VVAGPLAAALMAGAEGAIAGTALGSLAGALIGWGVPGERALAYETHIREGKFLVVVRGVPEAVARARRLLSDHPHHDVEVYEPVPS
jgi:outer membrane lipoprotein SlyB